MSDTDIHYIGHVSDIPEEQARIIADVGGREIAVFRIDGDFYGVLNFCVHAGGPLCEGSLMGRISQDTSKWQWDYDDEDSVILCPWHNWKFDVMSGCCIDDDRYSVPTYEVIERDGDLYVEL